MHPKAMKSGNPYKVRRGARDFTEDTLLRKCIEKHGEGKWHLVPHRAGLNRCRKSCRLRWLNYLRPTIKRGDFSADEVDLMMRLHRLLGNRWTLIAGRLPGRTGNDVKNFWNTNFKTKNTPAADNYRKGLAAKGGELVKRKEDNNGSTSCDTSDHEVILKPLPRTLLKGTSVLCSHNLNPQEHINSPPPGDTMYNNNNNNISLLIRNRPPANLSPDHDGIEWWNTLLGEELRIHGQEEELEEHFAWLKVSSDNIMNLDAERDLTSNTDESFAPAIEAIGLLEEDSEANDWCDDIWDLLNCDYN